MSKLRLSPVALGVAAAVFILADWGYRLAGDSFFPGGLLDEIAHALTTLIVLWALGPRVCRRFLIPALVASVAIDLDHIPGELGYYFLTRGTPRPYTHSLLTIVVVLFVAAVWRRRRDLWVGVAIGLAIHLWRDMAESNTGVALLWPFSYHAYALPHSRYLVVMAGFVAVCAIRCLHRRSVGTREPLPDGIVR
ncbi:MAG: metal-dependent hydrolase [Solirubrobacteraceae bacterium]